MQGGPQITPGQLAAGSPMLRFRNQVPELVASGAADGEFYTRPTADNPARSSGCRAGGFSFPAIGHANRGGEIHVAEFAMMSSADGLNSGLLNLAAHDQSPLAKLSTAGNAAFGSVVRAQETSRLLWLSTLICTASK